MLSLNIRRFKNELESNPNNYCMREVIDELDNLELEANILEDDMQEDKERIYDLKEEIEKLEMKIRVLEFQLERGE